MFLCCDRYCYRKESLFNRHLAHRGEEKVSGGRGNDVVYS